VRGAGLARRGREVRAPVAQPLGLSGRVALVPRRQKRR
jgi:hypothetical protein